MGPLIETRKTFRAIAALVLLAFIASAAGGAESEALRRFPVEGLALHPPKGWDELSREDSMKVVAWRRSDAGARDSAMIVVEAGRPKEPTALATANAFAKSWGGTVLPEPTTLDGVEAVRVQAKNDRGRSLRPTEAVICQHRGFVYMLMGGAVPGRSVADDVDAVRRSWKWIEFASPHEHLALGKPMSALGGAVEVTPPVLMSVDREATSPKSLHMVLTNFARGKTDFFMLAQLAPRTEGETFEQLKARFAEGVRDKFELKQTPRWHAREGQAGRVVMDRFTVSRQALGFDERAGEATTAQVIWAMLLLDEHRLVLVNFTLPGHLTADEVEAYSTVAGKIFDNIRPLMRPDPPQPGASSHPVP
jgi:hypothetical protein